MISSCQCRVSLSKSSGCLGSSAIKLSGIRGCATQQGGIFRVTYCVARASVAYPDGLWHRTLLLPRLQPIPAEIEPLEAPFMSDASAVLSQNRAPRSQGAPFSPQLVELTTPPTGTGPKSGGGATVARGKADISASFRPGCPSQSFGGSSVHVGAVTHTTRNATRNWAGVGALSGASLA